MGETWFASIERGGSFKRGSATIVPFLYADESLVWPLVGKHNLENVLLATTTTRLLSVPEESIAFSVGNFQGVAQRLEEVAVVNGVCFIHDSTSTTPVAGRAGVGHSQSQLRGCRWQYEKLPWRIGLPSRAIVVM